MTTRERPADRGRRKAREAVSRIARDARLARVGAGLSLRAVGAVTGVDHGRIWRFEHGHLGELQVDDLGAICSAVGLDLAFRAYPAGDAIRDAGQARLLERLRIRLLPSLGWNTEVPLPVPGDLRAWDAVIRGEAWRIGVEAETALDDVQAVERRLALKQRDGDVDRVILLIADTRRNRSSLAAAPASFARLPLRTREVLAALREGRDPGQGGIVIL
jgi:transcriptional regulator with XRE-family HTH domain